VIDEIAKFLDLNPVRFCLLGALLGNHILTKSDLESFHKKIIHPEKQDSEVRYFSDISTKSVHFMLLF